MIVSECPFNPVRDKSDVDQYGFVDLSAIIRDNVAPAVDSDGHPVGYSGIDDPNVIVGKPDDVFDSFRMRHDIAAAVKSKSDAAKANQGD